MPTGATDTYVLTTDATGVGTWHAAGGGGGGGGTVQGTDGTYDIQATDEGGPTAGNARGENSVDLQTARFSATAVASGLASSVLGGSGNTASGSYSTCAGGYMNNVSGGSSCCGGGVVNTLSGSTQ